MSHEPVIGQLFFDLSKDYVAQVTDQLQHFDIDRHFYALYLLGRSEEPLTQTELANQLQQDKVSVVRLVDYLSEAGYVRRRVDVRDRRKHHVLLEPKAMELMPEINKAFESANESLLSIFNDSEKKQFLKLTSKLQNFYEENPTANIRVNLNLKRMKS